MDRLVLFATAATVLVSVGWAFQTQAEEEAFKQSILANLTKYGPPDGMENRTVFMYMDIYQLMDVDEKQGILNLKLWFYTYYYMPHLAWNDTELGGPITVPPGSFWNPDIVAYDITDMVFSAFDRQVVTHMGIVIPLSSLVNVKVQCSFDVYFFPYDTQHCGFSLGQWTGKDQGGLQYYHLGYEDTFHPDGRITLDYYTPNDQWELVPPLQVKHGNRRFKDMMEYETLTYSITIARRPEFFLYVLTIPTILLVLLSCLTFVLPVDSGEKVSLAVTILLSQIVSLLVLSDIIPPSSMNFPLLGIYVLISIVLIAVSIVVSVIVVNIHFCVDREVPSCFKRIMASSFMVLIGLKGLPCPQKVQPSQETVRNLPRDSSQKQLTDRHMDADGEESCEDRKERRSMQWAMLAELIDRVCLIVYSITSVAITVSIMTKLTSR